MALSARHVAGEKRVDMRILITGSAGFIGSHTVDWFLAHTDWEIVGLDSFRHKGDSVRVTQKNDSYKIFCHDLNAPISDRLFYQIGPIDIVLNLASMSHVDTSISDPVSFWESNTRLIGNILEYAKRSGAKFIQCSTDEVYGPALDGYEHKEWDPILPSNPYAASKAAQEALCFSYWRTYNMPLCITNCMNLIMTRQDGEKYVPKTIRSIYLGETLTVHGNENLIGSRMYLDARNLADAWKFIIENGLFNQFNQGENMRCERFNIAGLEEINNLELAQRIAKMMGKELKYELVDFHKTRGGHDPCYKLSNDKILSKGWKQPIALEQTLQEIIDFTLSNKEWLL
jgi:dTDP-glucose 4,6-dehydratase